MKGRGDGVHLMKLNFENFLNPLIFITSLQELPFARNPQTRRHHVHRHRRVFRIDVEG